MEGSGFRIPYRTELTGLTIGGCSKRGWWQREVDRLLIGLGGRRKTNSGSKPLCYTISWGLCKPANRNSRGMAPLRPWGRNSQSWGSDWKSILILLRRKPAKSDPSVRVRCLKLKILIDRNGQRIFSRDFQSKSLGLCCRHLTSPLGRAKVIQFYTKESEAPSTSTPRTWACRDKNQLSVQRRVIHFFPANRTKPWEIAAGERSCRFHYPSMKWVLPVAFSLGFYLCTFFVDPFS